MLSGGKNSEFPLPVLLLNAEILIWMMRFLLWMVRPSTRSCTNLRQWATDGR